MPTYPGPLTRINYLNWPQSDGSGSYVATADPNSPAFDPTGFATAPATETSGFVSYGDLATDVEQYHRPLERLHGSGLHGSGVALGLELACAVGSPGVTVLPGLALDGQGRHVYLSPGGAAQLDPSAGVPDTFPTTVPVATSGVVFPTTGLAAGEYYVTIQWFETWNPASWGSDAAVGQWMDTPWLQMLTVADYSANDLQVVLGQVTLDNSSNVVSAGYGDKGGTQRWGVTVPAQSLELMRGVTSGGNAGAASSPWGAVRAQEGGGMEISVANANDTITVHRDGGGVIGALTVNANVSSFGAPGSPSITLDAAEATLKVGTNGNYGDVLVYNGSGKLAVSLIGDTAHAIVGGPGVAGAVRMLNAQANETMTLDGVVGSAMVQRLGAFANELIDVDTTFFHIHGTDLCLDGRSKHNNRALVDGGNELIINYDGDYRDGVTVSSDLTVSNILMDGNGVPLMGNPARKMAFGWQNAQPGTRAYFDVTLPYASQFTAICSIACFSPTNDPDAHDGFAVEVWAVDGDVQPGWISNSGGEWGNPGDSNNARLPILSAYGQDITFRISSVGSHLCIAAVGYVFYE